MYKRRGKRFGNSAANEDDIKKRNAGGETLVKEWICLFTLAAFAIVCLFFIQRQAQSENLVVKATAENGVVITENEEKIIEEVKKIEIAAVDTTASTTTTTRREETPSEKAARQDISLLLNFSEEQLATEEQKRRKVVSDLKKSGVIMATDDRAKEPILALQRVTRELIVKRYGPAPYQVEMEITFPSVMPDAIDGKILIELAPIELTPHVVFVFLEIVRNWSGGAFNRVAGHVLQTHVAGHSKNLAFQEYHPDFPHKQYTLGYAGRPGGPPFYISTIDNVKNHGPGSQGSDTEADGCFGKVLEGFSVIEDIKKHPSTGNMGFISSSENYIDITTIKLLR